MLKKTLLIAIAMGGAVAIANELLDPVASIHLRVVDDSNTGISGLKIFIHDDMGMDNVNYVHTQASGEAVLSNRSYSKVRIFGVADKKKIFSQFNKFYFDRNVSFCPQALNKSLNRWEPWNPEITHVIKRVQAPVPMLTHGFAAEGQKTRAMLSEPGKDYSMDLVDGDWLPPYGHGKVADVICTLLTTSDEPKWSQYDVCEERLGVEEMKRRYGYIPKIRVPEQDALRVRMRFPHPGDGIFIEKNSLPVSEGSCLYHRYKAPTEGYRSEFIYDIKDGFFGPLGTAYMRIRSEGEDKAVHLVTNENGLNFYWSPVYGSPEPGKRRRSQVGRQVAFVVSYKLNPNPVSRSLEWNGVDARTGKLVRPDWREDQRP